MNRKTVCQIVTKIISHAYIHKIGPIYRLKKNCGKWDAMGEEELIR